MTHPRKPIQNPQQRSVLPYLKLFVLLVVYVVSVYSMMGRFSIIRIFGLFDFTGFIIVCIITYAFAWMSYWTLSRKSPKQKCFRCLTFTFSLILIATSIETPAILSFIDYRDWLANNATAVNSFDPFRNNIDRIDEELITVRKPFLQLSGTTRGNLVRLMGIRDTTLYPVEASYDQNGFRNDLDYKTADVAVIGDSFIESGLVLGDDLLTTRLAQTLDRSVVNLGQSGYGPQRELIVLRRYALPLKPKLVIWCFFEGNDLKNVDEYRRNMSTWGETVNQHFSLWERTFSKSLLRNIRDWTSPANYAYKVSGNLRSGHFCTSAGAREQLFFWYRADIPNSDDAKAWLGQSQDIILSARELCRKNNAQFLLVYVPTKFRVYKEFCEFPPDSICCQWKADGFPESFTNWATPHGIPVLNLCQPFRQAAAAGKLIYFSDDTHWNAEANEIAAKEIVKFVDSLGWNLQSKP